MQARSSFSENRTSRSTLPCRTRDDLIESHVDGQDPAQRGAYCDITKPDDRASYEGIPHCLAVCVYARFTDHDDQRDDKKADEKAKGYLLGVASSNDRPE